MAGERPRARPAGGVVPRLDGPDAPLAPVPGIAGRHAGRVLGVSAAGDARVRRTAFPPLPELPGGPAAHLCLRELLVHLRLPLRRPAPDPPLVRRQAGRADPGAAVSPSLRRPDLPLRPGAGRCHHPPCCCSFCSSTAPWTGGAATGTAWRARHAWREPPRLRPCWR